MFSWREWRQGSLLPVKGLLIFFLLLGMILGGTYLYLRAPVDKQAKSRVVLISPGQGLGETATMLKKEGIIRSEQLFLYLAKQRGLERKLRPGEYRLSGAMPLEEVVRVLAEGRQVQYRVTIPEGYTLMQIAELLDKKGLADKERFLQVAATADFNYPFLKGLPHGEKRLEGYLFPDTYFFTRTMGEKAIINTMLKRFARELTPDFQSKLAKSGLTLHQAVTLASIIEREAKKPEDRPLVSAVFHNRLKKGMKLESCATVQYVLGPPVKKVLSKKDISIDSPYNTYKYPGLPPGPISNPGHASLLAAVEPAPVDYLYFVARPDGYNEFSTTFAQHEAAKKKYLP